MKNTPPQPGDLVLILHRIIHQDRAGESDTVIRRSGEIVSPGHEGGEALIVGDAGDILRCPVAALHSFTGGIAAAWDKSQDKAPLWVAAQELERWFPADGPPYTLRWLPASEIPAVLRLPVWEP